MAIQELFGIRLPVIQAPMAGWQGSELAIAVANAGGLGSLPCAMLSPDAMRMELQAIKAATDQAFNVNRLMAELGPINAAAPAFPLAADALAPLRKKAESIGSGDFSPLWAGQNTSGCQEISAADLTLALIR